MEHELVKKLKWAKITIAILVVIIAIILGSRTVALPQDGLPGEGIVSERPESFTNIDLTLFWSIWDQLKDSYVDDDRLNDQEMTYGAIKGMVNSLNDPYTGFLTPEEASMFKGSLNAELEGIGAELTIEEDILKIVSPLKNSPAEAAGIRPGDIIYKIGDELAADFDLFEAVQKIRGPRGTQIALTLVRKDVDEPFEVIITRNKIELDSVTTEELDDDIFLISINQFSDDTLSEFLAATREALLANAKGVIIDLRYNGGGYLEITVDMLGELLEPGQTAVKIESRKDSYSQVLETNGKARLAHLPVAVLINQGSASASEILAGALQDYGRAYLIGEQSFGKGTVQEVVDFPDGSSLRLTIARWLTPKGRDINKKGLTPDEVVEFTPEAIEAKQDIQLDRAIEYLKAQFAL